MRRTVFILGAGFNADVPSKLSASYPLVKDLGELCFQDPVSISPLEGSPSIESRFQAEIEKGNRAPIEKLLKLILEADMFCAPPMKKDSPYSDFFKWSSPSPILTFNYDGLAETIALDLRQWRPRDGFGLEVVETHGPNTSSAHCSNLTTAASREILHLHGSLYIIPEPYKPKFYFDPHTAAMPCFLPFQEPFVAHGPRVVFPHERVIAPVPDKAEGLKEPFIIKTYARAQSILTDAEEVTAIGYSFNPNDASSYGPLLCWLHGKIVRLVAPDSDALARRLGSCHPEITWISLPYKFQDWVKAGFPEWRTRN